MKYSKFLLLSFLSVAYYLDSCDSLSTQYQKWKVGQKVHTTSGTVQGRAASVEKGVSTYLSIPYAEPPIGDLRFAPPRKYKSKRLIDATRFGPSCPISKVFGGGALPNTTGRNLTDTGFAMLEDLSQPWDTFSEDCLSLNVWTKPQVGEKKKAVMVWIYGGGFTIGSSSDPVYDAQHLVDKEDVVVVSFNYRLNIFGFPGNPHSKANLGLLDQRLAIEWVRDNIHAFGGDPSRITLFGQSAGGISVDLYSFAWVSDPIVSGIILQSGTTDNGAYPKDTTAIGWYAVTARLGCGDNTTDPTAQLQCMRGKPRGAITEAIPLFNEPTGSAAFWPTVDEEIVFSDYTARIAEGNFIKVPMLIGNTNYEAGYFKTMASLWNSSLPESGWDYLNRMVFTCPAGIRAKANVAVGLPTWRYRYFGDFEELALTTYPDSGAYHASELLLLFATLNAMVDKPPSEGLVRSGRYLRAAWIAFAKDPKRGLRRFGWPEYKPERKTLVRLAYNNSPGKHLAKGNSYDHCEG